MRTIAGLLLLVAAVAAHAQEGAAMREQIAGPTYKSLVGKDTAAGPNPPEVSAAWLAQIRELRVAARDRYALNDKEYERPELAWTQSSFVQPQMMIHDRYFYDPVARKYTVDRYLEDLRKRYGGIDSVLIWQGYPNIGIDNRNQFDLFDDMPGGAAAVRQMIADFHQAHVRVLFPVYTWDQGTRRTHLELWDGIAQELVAAGADGINGDTQRGMPRAYRTASDALGHPLALEPEDAFGSEEMLNFNNLTWGYWKHEFVPSVSLYKWFEPRHMVNLCERWSRDHTDALQAAFFNGIGFESWENIWGIWNGITPRDAEALRRVATVERKFSGLLSSAGWVPHTPVEQFGVFASKWPGEGQTLWTFVNRNHYPVSGPQLVVAAKAGARYYDVWHGVELTPLARGGRTELSFALDEDGFGAVLESAAPPADLPEFLSQMKELTRRPLADFPRDWRALPQQLVEIPATAKAAAAPAGMVKIPAAEAFRFRVNGVEIEGQNFDGTDFQYPWEPVARRYHEHTLAIKAFWMDRFPVTNADFKAFLDATHYRPEDAHNFLRDWTGGAIPAGWEKKPVTWVSLEDARAYATWAGKRLPHEWEWQYAAQGLDGRTYPWGDEWNDEAAPAADSGTELPPPSAVDAHPLGASPFGIMDLVGNVWQWTDEYVDDHTRTAVMRGGSHYRPKRSNWYFPQAKALDQHGKLLLMAPSIDRAGTLGFRCVQDAP